MFVLSLGDGWIYSRLLTPIKVPRLEKRLRQFVHGFKKPRNPHARLEVQGVPSSQGSLGAKCPDRPPFDVATEHTNEEQKLISDASQLGVC